MQLDVSSILPADLSADERLLEFLQSGPQTLENLSSIPGLDWAQVFMAIDRLSRAGAVSLQRVQRCGYQVSLPPDRSLMHSSEIAKIAEQAKEGDVP